MGNTLEQPQTSSPGSEQQDHRTDDQHQDREVDALRPSGYGLGRFFRPDKRGLSDFCGLLAQNFGID